MKFKEIFTRAGDRIRRAREKAGTTSRTAGHMMRNITDILSDDWVENAFAKAREMAAPDTEELPVDFQLRQSPFVRRMYEKAFPVSHVFRLSHKFGRDFLDDFMPLSNDDFIGRGSYKFVYRLPWQSVLKVSKEILISDPIFGSQFREVDAEQDRFLSKGELELQEFLGRGKSKRKQEKLRFKFTRLGMERYHYWRVREALPDLVLPTKYFMGVRYRERFMGGGHTAKITPMDIQIMLRGKHLKEFASAGHKSKQSRILSRFSPRYDFEFQSERFGKIKKKVILKIADDFRRLIKFTELLALREKLILDIHTENIIITLPDFELKIFDFHLFDEHLYEPSLKFDRPEKDHIEVIEKFIDSLGLDGH